MPQVTFTIEVSAEQLADLLLRSSMGLDLSANEPEVKKTANLNCGEVQDPAVIHDVKQYLRAPGAPGTGGTGRPSKLSDAGLKKVWIMSRNGYNPKQISKAFSGLIGTEAVRRFIKRVKDSAPEKSSR